MTRWMLLLLLFLAAPASAQDAIDLPSSVLVGGAEVRGWPVTTTITAFSTSPQGIEVLFSKRQGSDWPDVIPAGWVGPVYYTVWLGTRLPDRVHLAASLNVYRGQLGAGAGDVTNIGQYSQNLWYLDDGLKTHVVSEGETLYLMVTAGGLRGANAVSVQERSNVVAFTASSMPRSFSYAVVPPPIVTPPPPPVVPPPVVPPPVPVPIFDTARIDAAIAELKADVDAGRAEAQAFYAHVGVQWGKVIAFVGKYVAPAIAGILGGMKIAGK